LSFGRAAGISETELHIKTDIEIGENQPWIWWLQLARIGVMGSIETMSS
jgi:hypothetical protein